MNKRHFDLVVTIQVLLTIQIVLYNTTCIPPGLGHRPLFFSFQSFFYNVRWLVSSVYSQNIEFLLHVIKTQYFGSFDFFTVKLCVYLPLIVFYVKSFETTTFETIFMNAAINLNSYIRIIWMLPNNCQRSSSQSQNGISHFLAMDYLCLVTTTSNIHKSRQIQQNEQIHHQKYFLGKGWYW